MGREIRMVPANWQHPQDSNGEYIPLLDGYTRHLKRWKEESEQWAKGLRRDYSKDDGWKPLAPDDDYSSWVGEAPDPSHYMPEWPAEQCTHFCMYETCSEGTPISPPCATAEECARWLADSGASAFGSETATYEQWLATCKAGWAASGIYTPETGLISGVAAAAMQKD